MASITIRNLDDGLKAKLRKQAAQHGRSMEEEARQILKLGVYTRVFEPRVGMGTAIRQLIEPLGGVDLEIPPRGLADRPPPDFSK